ncbi:MAG: CAP domain-containing protein [Tepidanaerobacteraceae bacterium]|nr:CAP domain-containing protein [Tepidanaerobacteraceae bacterium]
MFLNRKNIFTAILLVFILAIPAIASAASYYHVTLTINGNTQTIQIPASNNATPDSAKTYRYVYTYKDGKWVLTFQGGQYNSNAAPSDNDSAKGTSALADNAGRTADQISVQGLTADEQKMLDLVNAERKKAGVEPLKIDMRLVEISRKKSQDMIDKNYFSHTSPTYGTPFDALKANGISYRYAGENLAGAATVEEAHKALMASPGHRANILNPNYNYVGIGIIDGGPYGKMFTQTFIGIK